MDIFENICRTCGNECSDAVPIFNNQSLSTSILDMLTTCLAPSLPTVHVNDDFPRLICRICLKKLEMCYQFIKNWESASKEFNVALKFVQRRKRRLSQVEETHEKVPKTTTNDYTVITLVATNEDSNDTDHKSILPLNEAEQSVDSEEQKSDLQIIEIKGGENSSEDLCRAAAPFLCGICSQPFYTLKAYDLHHKFVHTDDQYNT